MISWGSHEHDAWPPEKSLLKKKYATFQFSFFLRSQGYSKVILRNSAVCQIETRASGMAWGPRSMGCALIFGAYQKVPPRAECTFRSFHINPTWRERADPLARPRSDLCQQVDCTLPVLGSCRKVWKRVCTNLRELIAGVIFVVSSS